MVQCQNVPIPNILHCHGNLLQGTYINYLENLKEGVDFELSKILFFKKKYTEKCWSDLKMVGLINWVLGNEAYIRKNQK